MRREVHAAFDSLDAAKWEEIFGVSKLWVRQQAAILHEEWLRKCEREADDEPEADGC
jgi:hypothetical protein